MRNTKSTSQTHRRRAIYGILFVRDLPGRSYIPTCRLDRKTVVGHTDKSQTNKTGDNRVNNKCPLAAAVTAVHCVHRYIPIYRERCNYPARDCRRRSTGTASTDGQDNALCWRRINRRRRLPRPR